jgi:hypothetical protein
MTWEFKQPESRARTRYSITIFECTAQDAPTRKTSDVRECATITFMASEKNAMPREGPDGTTYRVVRFDVRMTLLSMGAITFTVFENGRLAAQKDVRISNASFFAPVSVLNKKS